MCAPCGRPQIPKIDDVNEAIDNATSARTIESVTFPFAPTAKLVILLQIQSARNCSPHSIVFMYLLPGFCKAHYSLIILTQEPCLEELDLYKTTIRQGQHMSLHSLFQAEMEFSQGANQSSAVWTQSETKYY